MFKVGLRQPQQDVDLQQIQRDFRGLFVSVQQRNLHRGPPD